MLSKRVDTFLLFGCDDPSLLPQSLKLGSLIRVYRFFGKELSKGGDSDLLFGCDDPTYYLSQHFSQY